MATDDDDDDDDLYILLFSVFFTGTEKEWLHRISEDDASAIVSPIQNIAAAFINSVLKKSNPHKH